MNYKDGSWWICCAFIITISYILGTLTGIPTWSEDDTKLSVMADVATVLASLATLAAAFYAFKSFSSWRNRLVEQHKFEQTALTLTEIKRSYELICFYLFDYIQETVNGNEYRKWHKECKEPETKKFYENELFRIYNELDTIQNDFRKSCIDYDTYQANYKAISNKKTLNIKSTSEINSFYENYYKKNEMTNSDIIKIAEYSEIGRRLIDELFEEFYQNDKKN